MKTRLLVQPIALRHAGGIHCLTMLTLEGKVLMTALFCYPVEQRHCQHDTFETPFSGLPMHLPGLVMTLSKRLRLYSTGHVVCVVLVLKFYFEFVSVRVETIRRE